MGEDLRLPEREAIRTPMQWDDTPGAGFSRAAPEDLVAPVVDGDGCPAAEVNVLAQRIDPDSLLTWFERMLHTLRECPEIGRGEHHEVKTDNDHVLAHVAQDGVGAVLFVHNLADEPCTVSVQLAKPARPVVVASDHAQPPDVDLDAMTLDGYGYRWVRLHPVHDTAGG
jgi:maltose alpha-D-glucosyltransferase/alpha-amylase